MSESRYTNYPNAWCPLTDPHQAMLEAAIERAEAEPKDEWKARTAISALRWIVRRLDESFSEDWEAHCAGRQELAAKVLEDQAMGEDDFVQAGIAAREALKNINTNEQ